ncbi:MarR family transcriptional regulator [Nocardiopsis gilva YIM 90087]|uniref:MarR family transcriptional regulator n=1 Tax=Nocardiopsis gilva YIM 90087 TaxID=1235441 RepID=A0A223S1X8_9ACTN|nr:MarR family winged helix-turn-helix transcriptional regulator [Nocardiopsis gilva]ASU82118.1 MarR family transcriptional regulator [Nocardiopsis gilva YIM 90087]
MEYSHNDTELLDQPIGYWSWAAHKAVVDHIRANLAELGVTQPQNWILDQVLSGRNGRTREEITEILEGYLDVGTTLDAEFDGLIEKGLIRVDDEEQLWGTAEGEAVFRQCTERHAAMKKARNAGVTDADYITTLKVLQRMIHNVGGRAWHE